MIRKSLIILSAVVFYGITATAQEALKYQLPQNSFGRGVLLFGDKGKSLFLNGDGASDEGDRPFIDKYNIATSNITMGISKRI